MQTGAFPGDEFGLGFGLGFGRGRPRAVERPSPYISEAREHVTALGEGATDVEQVDIVLRTAQRMRHSPKRIVRNLKNGA